MNTNKEGLDALKAEGRNQTSGIMIIPIRVRPVFPWLILGGLMPRGHDNLFGDIAACRGIAPGGYGIS